MEQVKSSNYSNFPDSDLDIFFKECGGATFNKGVYRTHTIESSFFWTSLVTNYFPHYSNQVNMFGFDWMGRQFALDKGNDFILMFDCSTAESFRIETNIENFHNHELVSDQEGTLSVDLFKRIISSLRIQHLTYEECLGYKTPLFLGGIDSVENYEVCNMEVYWEIQCQIYLQIKDLPPGTKIESIKFKK